MPCSIRLILQGIWVFILMTEFLKSHRQSQKTIILQI